MGKRKRWSRRKDKHPVDDSTVTRITEEELLNMNLLGEEFVASGKHLTRKEILIWRAEHFDFFSD
jgi:hypothetical protein